LQQRKTEEAEPVEDGADEAKKAKPSEETNGEGGGEPDGKDAKADEQAPVSSSTYTVYLSILACAECQCVVFRKVNLFLLTAN